jgi:epoxyqueuosine reductase
MQDASQEQSKIWVRQKALELGFCSMGISKAEFLDQEAYTLDGWLRGGLHGPMAYMKNHFELRTDPRKLVPDAKSVISLACNYFSPEIQPEGAYKISRYAYGRDYHDVIREKLHSLLDFIRTIAPGARGHVFVDSAPVMERAWAARSGLGWIGKNTNLISKEHGSFLFLGEIILNLELEYDTPVKNLCGTCTRCIDACPTKALTPYALDVRKCVSCLTIENKQAIPEMFKNQWRDWIFGCDICQEVCLWNVKAKPHNEKEFQPLPAIASFQKTDWENLTGETFERIFRPSPLRRAGYEGLKKNIRFLKNNE